MNRGGGRGALMRKLLQVSTSTDTTGPSQEDSGVIVSDQSKDITHHSDESTNTKSKASFDSGTVASLPEQPKIMGARGRAKLMEMLTKKTAHEVLSTESVSSDETKSNSSQTKLSSTSASHSGGFSGRGTRVQPSISEEKVATDLSPEKQSVVSTLKKDFDDLSLLPEPETVIKRGTAGKPVSVTSNYLPLKSKPDMGVFEYDVQFSPCVDNVQFRYKYLGQHRDILGPTKIFDGNRLSLPYKLTDEITTLISTNPNDNNEQIEIKIKYRRKKRISECIYLYNNLFGRIMKTLSFVQFGQKKFDPTAPIIIPQHKLEIWPGYVTAVDEYEGGLMLCLDVSHRVLCQTTVHDHIINCYRNDASSFRENALKSLLGQVVLTRYNNLTYRIDDIDFGKNPLSTFPSNTGDMDYVTYYKKQYNIDIKDLKQPLLISRKERRVSGKDKPEEMTFGLIPEICYLTGLSDELRSDFKVMRDLATHTRVSPNQRMFSFKKFVENVSSSKEAKQVLEGWGLELSYPAVQCNGRVLDEELVFFGRNKSIGVGPSADFTRHCTTNECIDVIDITNWLLIHTNRDAKFANNFIDLLSRNSKPMGISVAKPRVEVLQNDRTESYVMALRKCINAQTQIVVLLCPTSRDDRYSAIKKICCSEIPIPSQVINSKTLSNDQKNRAIVQKIALQMNCKLGGTLWRVKIPFENVMICGIDTYHEAGKRQNSVSAFVASQNTAFTKWYSRAVIQSQKEELINGLIASFKFALEAYKKTNGQFPERIIIFRDGVGDGQLKMCSEYEIPQLKEALKFTDASYDPKFTFVVVQKRINTRLFITDRGSDLVNPPPGTVVDNTVTRKHLYDFFLVSQNVRQGTVSPTHYIVVQDDANFKPDILQRLAYKLCFLYYNWPGSVRVPACCQYAHKLSYLVGQSIKKQPAEKLSDKLFYL